MAAQLNAPQTTDSNLPKTDAQLGDLVVCCWDLSKRYGDFDALRDCCVQVKSGDIFGLLGPNGAGKTTLIRLLLGYLHPSSGRCQVTGLDPACDSVAVRRQVSYLPGDARLPRHMRGSGVLKFFAEIHPNGDLPKSQDVAARLELDLSRRVAFMSTGMRQKLALAVVLGASTPLLILDEPTANLDPTVRGVVLDLVREARDEGRTVIFSSHVLSEIEETCDSVAFLRQGVLAHELNLADLYQRHRVTAKAPQGIPNADFAATDSLADSISIKKIPAANSRDGQIIIDTSGDLVRFLPWIQSLQLQSLRIEPLGLRSVYDAVHAGNEVEL